MIQKAIFPDGGFVRHKITGDFSGKCSAWYDKTGKLIDAEQILNTGIIKKIKPKAAIWNHCAELGPKKLTVNPNTF
jgi:hypothetical protein